MRRHLATLLALGALGHVFAWGEEAERKLCVLALGHSDRVTYAERYGVEQTIVALLDGTPSLRVAFRALPLGRRLDLAGANWNLVTKCIPVPDGSYEITWELLANGGKAPLMDGTEAVPHDSYRALIQAQREAAAAIVRRIGPSIGLPEDWMEQAAEAGQLDPALSALLARQDESSLISLINTDPSKRPTAAHQLAIAEAYCWLGLYLEGGPSDLPYRYAARAVGHYNAAMLRRAAPDSARLCLGLVLMALHHAAEADAVLQKMTERGADSPKARALSGWIRCDPRYNTEQAKTQLSSMQAQFWSALTFDRQGAAKSAEGQFGRVRALDPGFVFAIMKQGLNGSVGPARQCTLVALTQILNRDVRYLLRHGMLTREAQQDTLLRFGEAAGNAGLIDPNAEPEANAARLFSPAYAYRLDHAKLVKPYENLVQTVRASSLADERLRFTVRDYAEFSRAQFFDALWNRFNVLAYQLGAPSMARVLAREFVSGCPGEPIALYVRGLSHSQYRQKAQAQGYYKRALQPDTALAVAVKAINKLGTPLVDPVAQPVLREARHDPRLCLRVVARFGRRHRDQLPIKLLERSLQIDPFQQATYARLAGLTNDATYVARGATRLPYSAPMQAAAGRFFLEREPERALDHFRKCRQLDPMEWQAYIHIGGILYRQGKLEGAISAWRTYLDIDRRSLRAVGIMNSIGAAYLRLDMLDEALAVYEEAAQSWQANAMAGLARTYERLGRYQDAESMLRRLAGRYARSGPYHYFAYYARRGRIADAENVLRAIARKGLNKWLRTAAASMYVINGTPEKIEAFYNDIYPREDSMRFAHVGMAKLAIGEWDKAADKLRQAVRISGWNSYAPYLYWALVELGEKEAAEKAVKDAIEKATRKDTRTRANRALLGYLAGDVSEDKFLGIAGPAWPKGTAHFYVGIKALADGKREAAKASLTACVQEAGDSLLMVRGLAKARLELMDAGREEDLLTQARLRWADREERGRTTAYRAAPLPKGPFAEQLKRNVTLVQDRISAQHATNAVVRQVGLRYDFRKSYANTNPLCRRYVRPNIKDRPCYEALHEILSPLGLTYTVVDGVVVLFRKGHEPK